MPPCQNLGFCMAPNFCNCPDSFDGPQCQFPKSKPCLDKPPTPMNSRVVCNEKECIATCNKGFAFLGGGKKLTILCEEGAWTQVSNPSVQQQGSSKRIPDCQRILQFYILPSQYLLLMCPCFCSGLRSSLYEWW